MLFSVVVVFAVVLNHCRFNTFLGSLDLNVKNRFRISDKVRIR